MAARSPGIGSIAGNGELGVGWSHFVLIHPCRVAGATEKLQPFLSNLVGWL
jgi:hypothetical protein